MGQQILPALIDSLSNRSLFEQAMKKSRSSSW